MKLHTSVHPNFLSRLSQSLFALLILVALSASAESSSTSKTLLPGTRFATESFVCDSGKSGPTVMIVGGVHGNEPAGAYAAESIRQWPLLKGKLVIVPRANVPTLLANKRYTPQLETNLSNLNRNYPCAGQNEGPRGEQANAIWDLAKQHKPDWMLDLHEGFDFHQLNNNSVGSSVINFPHPKGKVAADLMLAAINRQITEEKLKFVRRDMPIDGSLARAAGEHLGIPAMTVETTSKQPLEKRVAQQELLVHTLLAHLGMVSGPVPARQPIGNLTNFDLTWTAQPAAPPSAVQTIAPSKVRVALYKGPGTGGKGPPNLLKALTAPPATSITEVSPEEIQSGVLTNFHVVIFAGGSGSKEAEAIGEVGRSNVVNFIANGGGYVGICAGAYLCTAGYPWSLKVLNVKTVSPKWQRGRGQLKIELTATGKKILGETESQLDVVYANGPVVKPAELPHLPDYETLAYFRSEFSSNGAPAGVQINSPALIAAPFQKGRVVFCSPHPEQTAGLEHLIPRAVTWAARAESDAEKIISKEPKAEQ